MIHFGRRIRQRRLELRMSQSMLAKDIGNHYDKRIVNRTAIAQWESGSTREISGHLLLKVAAVLSVSPEWLMFGVK